LFDTEISIGSFGKKEKRRENKNTIKLLRNLDPLLGISIKIDHILERTPQCHC
jgi:hypothetical protein